MVTITQAQSALSRAHSGLLQLSQQSFDGTVYLDVVQALLDFQTAAGIDLLVSMEPYFMDEDYENVAAAVEEAALEGTIDQQPETVTYAYALDHLTELQHALESIDATVAIDLSEDLEDDYFVLLQAVGHLADRDVVDVYTAFEAF